MVCGPVAPVVAGVLAEADCAVVAAVVGQTDSEAIQRLVREMVLPTVRRVVTAVVAGLVCAVVGEVVSAMVSGAMSEAVTVMVAAMVSRTKTGMLVPVQRRALGEERAGARESVPGPDASLPQVRVGAASFPPGALTLTKPQTAQGRRREVARGLRAELQAQFEGRSCGAWRAALGGRVRATAAKRQRRGSIGARNRASPTVPVTRVK
jgi:hypothetical protein